MRKMWIVALLALTAAACNRAEQAAPVEEAVVETAPAPVSAPAPTSAPAESTAAAAATAPAAASAETPAQ